VTAPQREPTTTSVDEVTRAFARLVAFKSEMADTVEDEARAVLHTRASEQLTCYARGTVGPYRAAGADIDGRLQRLLVRGAELAGADLAARADQAVTSGRLPDPIVTPHFHLPVDVVVRPRRRTVHLDHGDRTVPAAARAAVRVLEAAASGDSDGVHVVAAAHRYLAGADGLVAAVDWLAELAAALTSRPGA